MPIDLLVHAFDHSKAIKGTIQDVRDIADFDIHPWGKKETLPNYIKIRIRNAAKEDVPQYLEPIKNKFVFTLIQDKGASRIYDIEVNPKILTLFGNSKGVTLRVIELLNPKHPMLFVDREMDNRRLRIDVQNTDFLEMFDDTLDLFEEILSPRRFHLTSTLVDLAIANGGTLEMTLGQINPNVIDRLA